MSTVHRPKGLEFNHGVLLDRHWGSSGANDDSEAARRLYYVAMTRARETLTLTDINAGSPFLRELRNCRSVRSRPFSSEIRQASPELGRSYHQLSLRDVQLSFAGYRAPGLPVHQAIARLNPGDPLRVNTESKPWVLEDDQGHTVGRLSQSFQVPPAGGDVSATVFAIASWDRSRSDPEYQAHLRAEQWEVVIPEIVVKADPGRGSGREIEKKEWRPDAGENPDVRAIGASWGRSAGAGSAYQAPRSNTRERPPK